MSRDSAATFLFADIAGFTALTEAHGDEEAVRLVEDFARAVQAELPQVDGEYVKAVGDALMLRVPDPANAIRLGLWITRNAMSGHRAPSVRVGGNFGFAIERGGDYFGRRSTSPPVCRPWREEARFSSRATQQCLRPTWRGCSTSRVGGKSCATSLSRWRSSLSLAWTRLQQFAVDPVCQMAVDPRGRSGAWYSTTGRTIFVRLVARPPLRSAQNGSPTRLRQIEAVGCASAPSWATEVAEG